MNKTSVVIYLLIFLTSCRQSNNISVLSSYCININDLAESPKLKHFVSFDEVNISGSPYCYFYNQELNILSFINILSNKRIDIKMDNYFNDNKISIRTHIQVNSFDSIWIYRENSKIIYRVDSSGKIRSHYNLTNIADSVNFELLNLNISPFIVSSNSFVFTTPYKDLYLFKEDHRKKYYHRKTDILFQVNSDSIVNCKRISNFPESYRYKYYNDFYPSRCFDEHGNLIYSFAFDHNIYVYKNYVLDTTVKIKSEFIKNLSPFDTSKIRNIDYDRKYAFEMPKYTDIVYDKYRNLYYRVVKHYSIIETKNRGLKRKNDSNWSVIVIDSRFNKITELQFLRSEYNMGCFLPLEAGLLLSSNKSEKQEEGQICYTLIGLNYEN